MTKFAVLETVTRRSGRPPLPLLLLIFASLLGGCDDECKRGKSVCLSDSLIRTCVPGDDDNRWMIHQCRAEEACSPNAADALPVSDGGPAVSGAACVGTCEVGQSECVSDEIARYCVNGKTWQLDACSVGEKCVAGVCQVGSDGGVRACVPGAKACASDRVEKVCDPDGTKWVENECLASEVCLGDECIPDPGSSCDDGSRCLDSKTAIRCLGEAQGFELVACDGDTWCEGGRCRGAVCALGKSCVAVNQIRDCADGVNYADSQCGDGEVCRQLKDNASCEPRKCNVGTTVCGDPDDPAVDALKHYSQCVTGASSGVPEWVRGQCTGNLECDPVFAGTGNPCRQDCTPGAEMCASDNATGIWDGFRVCQDDGTWGPVQSCNSGADARLQCALEPNRAADELPKHVCAEPVCAYVFNDAAAGGGACDGAQLRACKADGTLGDAAACEIGVCQPLTTSVQADGRIPAACDSELSCVEGTSRCLSSIYGTTPVYQVCDKGAWSPAFETCANDTLCRDYWDADGLNKTLCDAECGPGYRRCNGSGELETCSADGSWGGATACSVGNCRETGPTDAACVLDCVPNETLCAGSSVRASDNVSFGTDMELSCNADGTFGELTDCAAGTTCRTTATGFVLGCIECVGADAPGGNDIGLIDSRCDPGTPAQIQECGAGNSWDASRQCGSGKSCVGPTAPTCGVCLSNSGAAVVCTESNIDDVQTCGSCNATVADAGGATTFLSVCSETGIKAVNPGGSCNGEFGGSTTSWGGVADCCDGLGGVYLQTANATCSNMGYGVPTAWGGEPDCCSVLVQAAAGPSFAYCSE
ncbi:MAG: hypothetical protein OEZ06_11200 [Myxococcales bacterium]|nr:hypothetical protein [Myxococcales bacterium]